MRMWAFWRRLIYGSGFFAIVGLGVYGLYSLYLYTPPTCLDMKQNGDEAGVDCGGRCVRMCMFEVSELHTEWVRSFRVTEGLYNAVAYIENRNRTSGVQAFHYTFRLFDADGLIVERKGVTPLPPASLYPIFEGRIETGTRVPTQTIIEFEEEPLWVEAENHGEALTLVSRALVNADTKPVLTATVRNESLDELTDIDVVATIYNRERTALTVSRTKIPTFPPRSTRDITFTWQEPIAKTIRSCEVPSDVLLALDVSGSMNNDGGTPPEPITSALDAAYAFVGRLGERDQVGLVTYGSTATTVRALTRDREEVQTAVRALTIDPKEERGTTNIGEAMVRAFGELIGGGHNPDARTVLVLMTDGKATAPDPDPEGFAREAGEALKGMGVEIFTIGLGSDLGEDFLKSLASSDTHYYRAPSVETLGAIYTTITSALCEEGAAVIEVIPKQTGIFQTIVP